MNAPTPQFQAEDLPQWRLDDLYLSRNDPAIEVDLAAAKAANDALLAMKGRFVASRGDPAMLGRLIDEGVSHYQDATNALWSVGAYASLASSNAPGGEEGFARRHCPRATARAH